MNNTRTAAATAARKRMALDRRIRAAIKLLIDNGYSVGIDSGVIGRG